MADGNTTDLAPTTETPVTEAVVETPTPTPTADTSTTETEQSSSSDAEAGDTILTGAEAEAEADEPDTRTDEEKAADAAHAALFGAPEGEYELTGLPEGTVIDTAALEAMTPIAKELGLSNEGFSKIAQGYAEKVLPGVTQQVTDAILAQAEAQRADWGKEALALVKTDPAFAGAPLKDVQAAASKAIERFGGAELRAYLDDTGLGNHPAMVKAFFLAGSAIAEDITFERGEAAEQTKTRTQKYYNR